MASDFRLKEQLPELTERIVETYTDVGTINHLGHCPLPNYETIIAAIEDLKEILYPGYRRRDGLHLGNVTYHVGDLIDGLHDKLTMQIGRALRHDAGFTHDCPPRSPTSRPSARPRRCCSWNSCPSCGKVLALDVQAAYDGDPACKSLDEVIFCYPGLEAVTVYRLAHLLHQLEVPLIPRMMTEWAHSPDGHRHPSRRHDRPSLLHRSRHRRGDRRDERDRRLGQALSRRDARRAELPDRRRRQPGPRPEAPPDDRGSRVIYANATILGGQTVIGHDSVIGSSVWLTRSVDPHTTVVLEKPKLRMRGEHDAFEHVLNYQI